MLAGQAAYLAALIYMKWSYLVLCAVVDCLVIVAVDISE